MQLDVGWGQVTSPKIEMGKMGNACVALPILQIIKFIYLLAISH